MASLNGELTRPGTSFGVEGVRTTNRSGTETREVTLRFLRAVFSGSAGSSGFRRLFG